MGFPYGSFQACFVSTSHVKLLSDHEVQFTSSRLRGQLYRFLILCSLVAFVTAGCTRCPPPPPLKARVVFQGVGEYSHVKGMLILVQAPHEKSPVHIQGVIEGMAPGLHGMHIHEKGNISDDCKAAGPHFNPYKKPHGARTDIERHVGDLGNIESLPGTRPKSYINIIDDIITLRGERSVLGRAVVIHAGEDDLGRGNNEESKKTGNSGARVACGVIVPE